MSVDCLVLHLAHSRLIVNGSSKDEKLNAT